MPASFTLPDQAQVITLLGPAADAAGRTSAAAASLKHAHKAYLVFVLNQGNAATILLTPQQATAVAKTGAKAIPAVPIWANQDEAATSLLTRQADAVNFTTDAAVKQKRVIFEVDPSKLDVAGGFDCLLAITGASNVANITCAELWVVPARFQGTGGLQNLLVD